MNVSTQQTDRSAMNHWESGFSQFTTEIKNLCIGSVYQPDRSQNLWLAMQIKIDKNTKFNEAIESHESTKYGRGRVVF